MKKLLSLVTALVLALCLMAPAFAEEAAAPLAGKLVILHTNDMHGAAVATDDALGYARIAQAKKNIEALGADVLLLDAGDASQGTPIVNLNYGRNAMEFMNAAGYDAMTVGNHEFDWGLDNLLQNRDAAQFPMLVCNIKDKISGELTFQANKIFELSSGLKVGVFGVATPETMTKAHPDKVKGITFSMGDELVADVQAQVDELTNAGCDVIVALAHLGDADESTGNRSIDVLDKVSGINVFVDGHSHTTIDGGVMQNGALRTSTGSSSKAIGYVVVDVDKSGEAPVVNASCGLYTIDDNAENALVLGAALAEDEATAAVVNATNDSVNTELSTPFARTEVLLDGERDPGVRTQETNLGDFAADAILWAARQALGEDKVDLAVTNGGGIRTSVQIGDVTMLDMKTVFPFGNEVATLTVTGAELLEALEAATYCTPEAIGAFPQVAGVEFTIDTAVAFESTETYPDSTYAKPANPGSRVTITSVNGNAFDPEALYVVATNDFTAAGGDTYYAFKYPYATSGYKTGVALEDALVNYTQTVLGGVIGGDYAEAQGRIIVK